MTLGSGYQVHETQLHVLEQGNCLISAGNLLLIVFPEKVACPIGHAIGTEHPGGIAGNQLPATCGRLRFRVLLTLL